MTTAREAVEVAAKNVISKLPKLDSEANQRAIDDACGDSFGPCLQDFKDAAAWKQRQVASIITTELTRTHALVPHEELREYKHQMFQHWPNCKSTLCVNGVYLDCSCGLDAALSKLSSHLPEGDSDADRSE